MADLPTVLAVWIVSRARLQSFWSLHHQRFPVSTYSLWMHETATGSHAAALLLATRSLISVLVLLFERW